MTLVTGISDKNKNNKRIKLENGIALVLYKGDFRTYQIAEGEEIPEKEYEDIFHVLLPKRALDRSYKLLLSKDYTEKQIREKLSKDEYPEEIVSKTVEKLKEQKYINDERYTENFIFWKAGSKSKRRMMSDLYAKGISGEEAEEAYQKLLSQNDIDSEESVASVFLRKKGFDAKNATFEEKEKMKQTLLRKVFSFDTVNRLIGRTEWSE